MIKRSTLMAKCALKSEMQRFTGFQGKKEPAGVAKPELGAGNAKTKGFEGSNLFSRWTRWGRSSRLDQLRTTTETQIPRRSACKLRGLCVFVVNVKSSTIYVKSAASCSSLAANVTVPAWGSFPVRRVCLELSVFELLSIPTVDNPFT